jgi:cephalosporin hydroxylase
MVNFKVPIKHNLEEFERIGPAWRDIVMRFHQLVYASEVWLDGVSWRGVRIAKMPTDLWIYQEMIYDLQPDLIIETGTGFGGSAAFFAAQLDLNGRGRVITIDDKSVDRPQHPRIEYWQGFSIDDAIIARLRTPAAASQRVMVVLDSAHSTAHVSRELALYSPFVTVGSYLVVEDGK